MRTLLLLADLHVSLDYPMGCTTGTRGPHQMPESHASVLGTSGCDAPLSLLHKAAEAAHGLSPRPELALVAGDLVPYSASKAPSSILSRLTFRNVSTELAAGLPMPACIALGNNDAWPDHATESPIPEAAALRSTCGLRTEQASRGYYTRDLGGGLELLVLNTAPYDGQSLASGLGDDPLGQFVWLEAELSRLEALGSKALLLGHIPPGIDQFAWPALGRTRTSATPQSMWREPCEVSFWAIVSRHAGAVGGLLFGHTHTGWYRVWGGRGAAARPPLLSFGALAPVSHTSPALYTLALDETNALSAVTPYHLDLGAARPAFEASAALPAALGASALTNDAFEELTERLRTPAADEAWSYLFGDYYRGASESGGSECRRADDSFEDCHTCTGECRLAFCCLLAHGASTSDHRRHCRPAAAPLAQWVASSSYSSQSAGGVQQGADPHRLAVGVLVAPMAAVALLVFGWLRRWPPQRPRASPSRATTGVLDDPDPEYYYEYTFVTAR